MKSLMFTLLDLMARDAGCRDEAWELVLEFADAEQATSGMGGFGDDAGETIAACAFEVPAEAMLRCLSEAAANEHLGEPGDLGLKEPGSRGVCFNDIPVPDPIQELLVNGTYDALPKDASRMGSFSGDANGPWDNDDDTDLDGSDDLFNSLYPPFDPSNR